MLLCPVPRAATCWQALHTDAGFPSLLLRNCWALQKTQLLWLLYYSIDTCLAASCAVSCRETRTAACPASHPAQGWVALPTLGGLQHSARGKEQRGGGSFTPVPTMLPAPELVTTWILPSPLQEGIIASMSNSVRWEKEGTKLKRCLCERKIPGVFHPAQGLHLALPPEHHIHLCAFETVSETKNQEAVTDIMIMRKQILT